MKMWCVRSWRRERRHQVKRPKRDKGQRSLWCGSLFLIFETVILLPASDSQRSLSSSPLNCFPSKHKPVIRNLSIQPSGAKGLSPGLDLSSCQHQGCWLVNIFLNAGPECQAPEAESWSLLRCCCRFRMSHQDLEPTPRQVHGIWTLADLATWAAKRGDSWHCYPHRGGHVRCCARRETADWRWHLRSEKIGWLISFPSCPYSLGMPGTFCGLLRGDVWTVYTEASEGALSL